MQSAALQLSAAMSSLTFALATGISGLLGLGPALTMIAAAITAQPAGRMMDRVGRVPVLVGGFFTGAIGSVLLGVAGATGSLTRAAAGDMYPHASDTMVAIR